jgi:L-lactate dehydrogenase
MPIKPTKVSIIGAGFVGATTAYTLMLSGLVSEIVLVDVNKEKAEGEAMDMSHGMPLSGL